MEHTYSKLWYRVPASMTAQHSEEPRKEGEDRPSRKGNDPWETGALPVGNAYMGAMVYGNVDKEIIQFNEKTLWSGGPGAPGYTYGENGDVSSYLPEIRELLLKDEKEKAGEIAREKLVSNDAGFGAYQNFGELRICCKEFQTATIPEDYVRQLNLDTATASVRFTANGIEHSREIFCSYPDRVIVLRLSASKPVSYEISLNPAHPSAVKADPENKSISFSGNLQDNGLYYEAGMVFSEFDGSIKGEGDTLIISENTALTLIISCGTDYKNVYPNYRGENPHKAIWERIDTAILKGYEGLYKRHLEDYQPLFSRVKLDLGGQITSVPTDEMLASYPKIDPHGLETIMFNYGRYLLISSSRPGTLPANLQGVWNDKNDPAWCSDYHFNINLQMNYWPAEVSNLTQCSDSLVDYVESLQEPGEVSAKKFFGVSKGWTVNTMNNPYGFTAPGWEFNWGWAPNSTSFICRNLWDKYEFHGDKDVLKRIYPILKGAADCWSEYVTPDSDCTLVSSPSYSPEHGHCEKGCAMDQQLIYDLFTNTITAARELDVDRELQDTLESQLENISNPLQIGSWGQIQEWKDDLDDPNDHHRHISQLVSLYPCPQITPDCPELMNAAKTTLVHRGDEATGWSRAWKLCMWARLRDGDHAHRILEGQLTQCTYGNLFDTHPPFQIDGNFGFTAGVCEMLLQSHAERIDLLPSLPSCWPKGEFSGLVARGGFVLSVKWSENKAVWAEVFSKNGSECRLGNDISIASVTDENGKNVELIECKRHFSFSTEKGKRYQINFK